MRNLNIAQISGIAYSAVMLGILLPKLNISMTKNKKSENLTPALKKDSTLQNISIDEFLKNTKK